MTDANGGAPAPKKRSFFKRAAWQDAPFKEGSDMFSHANEFKDIVAVEQQRREEEQQKKAEAQRKQKQEQPRETKRRRVSDEADSSTLIASVSGSSDRPNRNGSKARSRTPLSPAPSQLPAASLAARYESLAQTSSLKDQFHEGSVIIEIGDSDEDDNAKEDFHKTHLGYDYQNNHVPLRSCKGIDTTAEDELEEVLDPTLAALAARARERASKAKSSVSRTTSGEQEKAPIAQLFIDPQIPDARPLMVRIRVDSTLERTKSAWCDKQGYTPEMEQRIIFTWKGSPVYDSTTVKRLGIKVESNGYISVEGDTNIYDDTNLPKVHVEAWTEELYKQWKKENAEEVAARRKAAEPSPEVEEREPTPEAPKVTKMRLILKAKGKTDFNLFVNPDTTFAHIAHAYKSKRDIEESQPVTLMFDGDRLSPLDTIADSDIEDMDALEVHFK